MPGVRVSPSNAANMPKIVTPNAANALRLQDGANHWRFVGIEIYSASTYKPSGYTPGVNFGYALVDKYCYPTNSLCRGTSNIPDSIIFDRCYVHGDATHDLQEGIVGNGTNFAVIDSYISEIHGKGLDTQAFVAYVTPGPIKLVNNHLEGSGENVMFGGSGNGIYGFVPSDIEVRNNHLYKPLSWVPLSLNATYSVKNGFELKSAQRVLFDSNIIENVWQAGQAGAAFLFTIRTSQSGDVAAVTDVTVTNNSFKNVVAGFQILSADSMCGTTSYPNCHKAGTSGRYVIQNNLFTLWDKTTQGGINAHTGLVQSFAPGSDIPAGNAVIPVHDILIQHNTVVPFNNQTCWGATWFSIPGGWKPPFPTAPTNNVWILDNVLCRQPTGDWGQQGTTGLTQYMGPPSTAPKDLSGRFYGNVMYVPVGDRVYTFPPHNYGTTVPLSYVNPATGNYQLASPRWTDTSDGQMAGVNFARLPSLTSPAPAPGTQPAR